MSQLLAISDMEDPVLSARLASRELGRCECVVSCGDLLPSYLDYVATLAHAPLAFVRGNHDTDEEAYERMGGTALDDKVVRMGHLRLAGLGGSRDYSDDIVGYSESQMKRRALRLLLKARLSGGIDVLVTHAPPRGFGDLDDYPHQGFECFNWLLNKLKPKLMLYGHVHLNYGMVERSMVHPSGTMIVNAYGHQLINLEEFALS
ncbi:MAG: metallophosphoesterase [Atopobiaceae bacterium]|nr:metallophosphoesterase [Atopobiaceae bacterium]